MLKKLGKTCAFVGKVGKDMFGVQLRQVTEAAGICMDGLVEDTDVRTTLAFVKTFANGDRDFSFYRNPGADMMLRADELPEDIIAGAKIFHFGTLSLTHQPVREATQKAVALAKQSGAILSFDPNLRPPLWNSLEEAKEQISWGLGQCDVLKIADNEIEFMTGTADFDAGAAILLQRYPNIKVLNVTAGANGSYSYFPDGKVFVPSCKLGGVIETTGAGDTFCACVLNYVLEHGLTLTAEQRTEMLRFANTAAYLVTTKKGAIRSMPERSQVE
jgi:fructokinase